MSHKAPVSDMLEGQKVLVVDFGAQYAQLIARRVREAQVYSEIVPHSMPVDEMLALKPAAIILSGGPASVYAPGAPGLDPKLFEAGIPVLGICYGFQVMAQSLGGKVAHSGQREYGRAKATILQGSELFRSQPEIQDVWMSHGDAVTAAPPGFDVVASTDIVDVAAFECPERHLYGVQWHPEVVHTSQGQATLRNFLHHSAGLRKTWTTTNVIADSIAAIRKQIGSGHVICGLSGGVDSAVAAALVHEAVGDQLTCVFVDHGLLRKGEVEQVKRDFVEATGIRLRTVDASKEFLEALQGCSDPETKRKIIGRVFIRTFEHAAAEVINEQHHEGDIEFLVQGTLYPDVVESGGGAGADVIKSHHNVGGLPEDLEFQLVEPLKTLFKDEVRAIGLELGLPSEIVRRHPFPGPGLAIRIVGEVTPANLETVREADAIAREELDGAGQAESVWQMPVVLLADVRSVGVQGDGRTYGHPIVLRPVTSEDAMTADRARLPDELLDRITTRITNEVPGVNRVVLDLTSKPPGTIEWE